MDKLITIIVDDEQESRKMLLGFLSRYCPDVIVAGEAASVAEAAGLIKQVAPHLVLLDISMPRESGFELFNKVDSNAFHTVFITAHDEFALEAFKHHAIDYILKPVNIDALILAVNRAKKLTNFSSGGKEIHELIQAFQRKSLQEKINLPVADGYIYIATNEIIRCEAEGNYTTFHFTSRSKLLVTRNIGVYEALLKNHGFIRVHHQHLINIEHVQKYQRGRGGAVIMSDKVEVAVSQRKKDEFLRIMGGDS